jgi:hypothetical protein
MYRIIIKNFDHANKTKTYMVAMLSKDIDVFGLMGCRDVKSIVKFRVGDKTVNNFGTLYFGQ